MNTSSIDLSSGFLRSVAAFPDRPALEADGQTLTYAELSARASKLAATLDGKFDGGPTRTAVFAYRTLPAFTGVLAALLRGHAFIPLNRTFPVERTRTMLINSGCRSVVADAESARQLKSVLEGVNGRFVVVLPEEDDVSAFVDQLAPHVVLGRTALSAAEGWRPVQASPHDPAYILFTSGSTGIPKGVIVTHRNVIPFVAAMVDRYEITEADRFTQMFDQTFDLSVFDMFVCWERGACLCCPSAKQLLQPGGFIRSVGVTVWFSVPSTAMFMKKLGALKKDSYPDLRLSLFCGEALPVDIARAWSLAAPNSVVENLYGPTEVTIACMLYRWNGDSEDECELGLVPIGYPYPDMSYRIVDTNLRSVPIGAEGELLMTGPQVTPGYLDDEEKTAASFVVPPGTNHVFYRTGDRVRVRRPDGPVLYLGRMDHQVKIRGHRVELGEVEVALREESGVDGAVAVAWPKGAAAATGIVAFLQTDTLDVDELRRRLKLRLPDYMVPREIRAVARFPLNANGKFDRRALLASVEDA